MIKLMQVMKPYVNTRAVGGQTESDLECSATLFPEKRRLHSITLFGQEREVLIEHGGFTYRLRITQANKLILTK